MSRRAWVGLFTLLGIVGFLSIFYVITDIATRSNGYKIGIHFDSAAGLRPAALVYESGVGIGAVDRIDLLPDYTTEVIVAVRRQVDIPNGSRFLINTPLTGEPSLLIIPPRREGPENPALRGQPIDVGTLPHEVLPLAQQPKGTNSASITDLLEEGQGQLRTLDRMLAQFSKTEPQMLAELQQTLHNANALTVNANSSLTRLTTQFGGITDSLQKSLSLASANIVDLSSTLDSTAKTSSGRVDTLLVSLNQAATQLSASIDQLHSIAANPQVKDNLIETTRSIALTTKTLADLTNDLRQVTGNPQTQGQLRDTVANIDAASQKADSLFAALGGKSSVYGVDAGATPIPGGSNGGGNKPGGKPPASSSQPVALPANIHSKVDALVKNLAEIQVRVGQLAPQRPGSVGIGSPLLTSDRGPQTDINLIALPKGSTSLMMGANDIGAKTTYNFSALSSFGHLRVGGGVLYSRLGLIAKAQAGRIGLETRLYDPRHPTLDAYGTITAVPHLQLFGGERDTLQRDRRSVFGVQANF